MIFVTINEISLIENVIDLIYSNNREVARIQGGNSCKWILPIFYLLSEDPSVA